MANIKLLAEKTERLCRLNQIRRPVAARKVVRAQGITNELDVKRISSDICSELGRRGGKKTAANRRNKIPPKKYRTPVQLELL